MPYTPKAQDPLYTNSFDCEVLVSPAGKYIALSVMVIEMLRDNSFGHAVIVGLRRTGAQHSSHCAEECQR